MGKEDIAKLRAQIKKVQDKKRFEHTLGVTYTAACLAMCYDIDTERAEIAGLLHDCAKCLSNDKKISLCKKQSIEINLTEAKNPFLLHAKAGAYLAEHKYGVRDEDILNAVRYHTTGRPGMSMLEKIVFIADYIEPGRNHSTRLPELRRLAFQNLDKALVEILKDTLRYLRGTDHEIDPMTQKTYDHYNKSLTEISGVQ
ncbi:MAG: HD domain-containing protein [Lachnospiraceae bacterium]|jgi:predicted HD superfamily hydrolase involved in NAD metabolism|nr:HD domain-containing protein [Lachnospiraceae bacterium]